MLIQLIAKCSSSSRLLEASGGRDASCRGRERLPAPLAREALLLLGRRDIFSPKARLCERQRSVAIYLTLEFSDEGQSVPSNPIYTVMYLFNRFGDFRSRRESATNLQGKMTSNFVSTEDHHHHHQAPSRRGVRRTWEIFAPSVISVVITPISQSPLVRDVAYSSSRAAPRNERIDASLLHLETGCKFNLPLQVRSTTAKEGECSIWSLNWEM
ncbi:hypothetical protein OPV22_022946 [Ensete ventricosum]|uniref:Uncharacterized protein n=1 Tax=Ensete ventricosum TaxID=4639 RepID=A0AAV8QQS6_ENSVE|nr:hypothetical protein OPV22_022946 [Ensete ventricosum]